MKNIYLAVLLLSSLVSFGQVQKGKYLTTGTLLARSFRADFEEYNTLQLGFQNKTGYFVSNSFIVGVKADYTWSYKETMRTGAIQQGGSQWVEKGIFNRHEFAVGVFADKYFKLAKKLYITVGAYAQYYNDRDKEDGVYYDQDGNPVGISYTFETERSRVAQFGLSNSVVYFLNQRFGINCLVSALDVYVSNRFGRGTEFEFRAPIMNLGIQYHFPR